MPVEPYKCGLNAAKPTGHCIFMYMGDEHTVRTGDATLEFHKAHKQDTEQHIHLLEVLQAVILNDRVDQSQH